MSKRQRPMTATKGHRRTSTSIVTYQTSKSNVNNNNILDNFHLSSSISFYEKVELYRREREKESERDDR